MMRPLIQQFVVTSLLISENVMTEASRVYILIWSNEKRNEKNSVLASVHMGSYLKEQFHTKKHMQQGHRAGIHLFW